MQRVIGVVFLVMGTAILCFAPVHTVTCSGGGKEVSCEVRRAALNVVPLKTISVSHIQGVRVEHNEHDNEKLGAQPVRSHTYQLAFVTRTGTVRPSGMDAVNSTDELDAIASEIEGLLADSGPARTFTRRQWNGFATFAGVLFALFGFLALLR